MVPKLMSTVPNPPVYLQGRVEEALTDFCAAAILAQIAITRDDLTVELLRAPHKAPTILPAGMMAVYAFFLNGVALKVGKAGQNSQARYTSQHYNAGSAPSTLAASIMRRPSVFGLEMVDTKAVGTLIKARADRVNILLPASFGNATISLLEAFLHCRWKPVFEGRV
jgi:hypothetical protein